MKPFEVIPVSQSFAAEIKGLRLKGGVSQTDYEEVERVLAQYGVLVVRNDEPMNDDDQEALIEKFGPPVMSVLKTKLEHQGGEKRPHFLDIATVDAEGKPLAKDSFEHLYHMGNLLWHTDGTQIQPPIRITMLSARVLPPNPPNTEYADMRAAWDALSDSDKALVENLKAEHSIFYSRAKVGLTDFPEEAVKLRPPVAHPLVRTHKVTGRKSLYLASHASHIIGWDKAKGRDLLDRLTEHATQRKFVYPHQWETGDMVIWDDSFTMHRATPYDAPHARKMRWSGAQELHPV